MTIQDRSGRPARPISTAELHRRLADPDLTLVDTRPMAAFNGWRLNGEARGGHIPGAVALPEAWLRLVDDAELERLARAKGLTPDRTVVLYGDEWSDASTFLGWLGRLGHTAVHVYAPGFPAWASEPSLPVEQLPRFEKLVYPGWVRHLIDGGSPDTYPGDGYLLLHVNFGVPEEYGDGHLPGAVYLDTNRLEDPADWNRRSPEEIEATLRELGIRSDSTVILYGRDTVGHANEKWPGRRAGQIAATRAALVLRYAGVDDVRVLDGGYDAWIRAGHQVETVPREPTPVDDFGLAIPHRPDAIVDIDEAREILADEDGVLVSVRTWNEHIGLVSGYNYIGPAGRIAGDVWGNCGSDAYHMQHYRTVENTMRAYTEIAANWAEAGITRDRRVSFYCGTGWRAAETWFYAYLMGWERISVYDGGWFEWSQDPSSNPIEVGQEQDEAAA